MTTTATPTPQPPIGKLLDEFSALPVLWGLGEPGALVRHGDVFKMLVNAGKTYLAATTQASTAQVEPVDGVRWDLFPGYLIDHCEGGIISEEGLQHSVAAMLKDPAYLAACAATSSTDSALAAEARDAVLEEVADALELLNDPAGDAAAYDNRDMDGYELERMNAIQHCVNTVLALRSATATGSGECE